MDLVAWLMSLEWGDVPTWLGSIGTWLGSIATVWTLWVAVKVYRGGLEDARKAQARLLTPMIDPLLLRAPGSTLTGPGQLTYNWPASTVQTRAADGTITETTAGRPVKTVRTRVVSTAQEGFTDIRLAVFDADGQDLQLFDGGGRALPPGEVIDLTHIARPGTYTQPLRLRVTFCDAAGRYWERWSDQPLTPLKRRPALRTVPPSAAEDEMVVSHRQLAEASPGTRHVNDPTPDIRQGYHQQVSREPVVPPGRRETD